MYFEPTTDELDVRDYIFDFCQYRPRDVLTYLYHAIECSKGQKHELIALSDLDGAKKVYSENRLKDLGNEYAENFPNIAQVLGRFHGLAKQFTVNAVTNMIKKLMADPVVKQQCATWMYSFTAPHQFIELMYGIGFVGITTGSKGVSFRGSGVKDAAAPPIDTTKTLVVVHPSYVHGLDFQIRSRPPWTRARRFKRREPWSNFPIQSRRWITRRRSGNFRSRSRCSRRAMPTQHFIRSLWRPGEVLLLSHLGQPAAGVRRCRWPRPGATGYSRTALAPISGEWCRISPRRHADHLGVQEL